MRAFLGKLVFFFRRRRFEDDLGEEMRLHQQLRSEQLEARGIAEAPSTARRRFGNPAALRDLSRDVWTWRWLEDFAIDLRFATRILKKKLGFSTVAAVTLALGIGSTTAVFSIVNAVLLRPLPYRDPDRLVAIWDRALREKGMEKVFAPYTDYEEWQRNARSFEKITAATWAFSPARILTGRGPAKQLLAIPATASFFETLGAQAALGRTFTPDDERRGCTVVLSHGWWANGLGADAGIVGKSLTLDQRECTVVGVMPANFSFYPGAAQLWTLLGPDFEPPRAQATAGIFARLKPGITRAQAQAEIAALHRAAHPSGFWHDFEPAVYDLHGEFTFLASRTLRITLIVTFAAVLLVLLIAALNVASLLVARLAERQRELAVRAALGSGHGRLVRQVLTESLLLSAIGAAGGIGLACAALRYFRHASPIQLTVGADVGIHLPILLFAIGVALATALLFGLLPAIEAGRIDVIERLKTGGRGTVAGALRPSARSVLISVEMGVSFLLLIGAGLLLRSALRMGTEPLGFNFTNLYQTRTSLPIPRYREPERRVQFYKSLLDRLNGMNGVSGAAITSRIPPYPSDGGLDALEIQERPAPPDQHRHDVGLNNSVSPRFFEILRIPLIEGREFLMSDTASSLPVAIVNEALVRDYFPNEDPLGKQVRISRARDQEMPWLTIIGVAGDLKHPELMNEMTWIATPVLYRPLYQTAPQRIEIAIRTSSPRALEHEVQEQISGLDSSVPVNGVQPVETAISEVLAYPRFRAAVLGFFALTALLLSAVGLNGVLSQIVAQRRSEFGIRKAIGAQPRDVLWLVLRQGGAPIVLGMSGGILCTFAFSRLLSSLLYGIKSADIRVLLSVAMLFVAMGLAAIALPAYRASRIDPLAALRDE
jgi:putative ABC transport system permease protein